MIKKILTTLLFITSLTLFSCEKEHYCYSLDVFVAGNGLIRVDYFSEIGGYTLLLGCEPGVTEENAYDIKVEPVRKSGGWALTRQCNPTYVKIISPAGEEEVKI